MSERISFESKCICYLSAILKENGEIRREATCTGFFWRNNGLPYLVTNRHCVTGKDSRNLPVTENHFSPNSLIIRYLEKSPHPEDGLHFFKWVEVESSLFESNGDPTWYEHPTGSSIDLIAIPFLGSDKLAVDCINDRKKYEGWLVEAGSDCFIVGYPEGFRGSWATPIWKRASIASEPDLDFEEKPLFLCDSATRKGMSGSPVFGKAVGFFGPEGSGINSNIGGPHFFGYWPIFLGVYSGRNGDEGDGFQLARVWKYHLIDEIVTNRQKAASPFIRKPPIF